MPYKNLEDRRAANRRSYRRHREKTIAAVVSRKRENTIWWTQLKQTMVCWHCGENDPDCIDLHHVIYGSKRDSHPAHWVGDGRSRERILEDLKNCVPLCANCHRKVHAQHRRMLREASTEAALG